MTGVLNDLWQWSMDEKSWHRLSSQFSADQAQVSGVRGILNAKNVPGPRSGSAMVLDVNSQILIMYGGWNSKSQSKVIYAIIQRNLSTVAVYNDLWVYDLVEGMWAWTGGRIQSNQYGKYFITNITKQVYSGSRAELSMVLKDDTIFIFGGFGYGLSSRGKCDSIDVPHGKNKFIFMF